MKIVLLGSSFIQLEAIEYLNHRDIEIHVLSKKEPVFQIKSNNHFEKIDIRNREEILQYCKNNSIDFIYSIGSDFGVLTANYVSEKLGLKQFNSFSTTWLFQNKLLFRNFLKKHKLSKVTFLPAKNISDLRSWNIFPCVIKPADSQGQRGVSIIESRIELNQKFHLSLSFSGRKEVIVEEFLRGKEISINVFVTNGEITHFYISDRITAIGTNSGIPWRHIIPSGIPKNIAGKAFIKTKSVIKEAKIMNGPVYFQMKYTKSDVEIIEATPRLDGCHLWRLIDFYSGINLLKLTINSLLGINNEPDSITKNRGKFYIEFKLQKPGEEYVDIIEKSLFRISYYKKGQIIKPTNGILEKTIMHLKKE